MGNSDSHPKILIVEDDPDQMDLLASFAVSEIENLLNNETVSNTNKEKLAVIHILKATSVFALKQAVSKYKQVIFVILDGNIPDDKGSPAHDQLIKTDHKITGQHKSINIIMEHLPNTPITMISSLNRFQRIVTPFYEKQHSMDINFINKSDQQMIQRNMAYYLRHYLRNAD